MDKVEALRASVQRMVNSQEWKEAKTLGAKLKIAWDTIIAEPFNEWWNSTGKAWLSDKAASIGRGIGSGIKTGLLALLGIDVSETLNEGKGVGSVSFKASRKASTQSR